jgi:uncharacterized glyoxalase superfamily protein PhnB
LRPTRSQTAGGRWRAIHTIRRRRFLTGWSPTTSSFERSWYVGDADALYEEAVAAGAKPLSPPADQPYGDRVARVEDPMGNVWFIARPA